MNTSRPKLGTREIRHALGMLIERERLIRSLRIPNATAAYAPVPPEVKTAPEAHPAPYQKIDADDLIYDNCIRCLRDEEAALLTRVTPTTIGEYEDAIERALSMSEPRRSAALDILAHRVRSAAWA